MKAYFSVKAVERATGIEPAYRAWEASVLPLNYARHVERILRKCTIPRQSLMFGLSLRKIGHSLLGSLPVFLVTSCFES